MTSTVDVFTPNGASTVISGFSPGAPLTVTASNLSVDAPAGAASANEVTHIAMSAASDARTTAERRTRRALREVGTHHATGGFGALGRGGTPPAWLRGPPKTRFVRGRTPRRGPVRSRGS